MSELFNKSVLSNGARLLTEYIPSVRSVSVGAWVGAGSRDETENESGMCHFIEHMVFKGTRNRRMHHIAQRMENVGGYLNAFTAKEFTCFYARSLDEHVDRALDTVIDLIGSPVFPEKDMDREKDVVVEEMKMYEDTPDERVYDHLDQALYGNHPMGRPVIGVESSVRSFTRDGLFSFLERHYTPENTVIAIAGNVKHERAVRLAEKAFRDMDQRSHSHQREAVLDYTPKHLVEEKPLQQAHLVVGTRAYDVHDDKRIALSVLNSILGGGMSSRLNQNIREKYGYCYNIYSFNNLHSDTGEFGVYMGTDATKVDHSVKLIFREFEKVRKKSVSKRELDRAISQAKGSIMLGLESMGSRMMRIGRQELYYGRYYSLDEIMQMVEQVSIPQIAEVANEILDPSRFSIVRLIPGTTPSKL
ncbi:MAG: insulinase family protein [Bacteroidetes Order II. Incertae sedis bacterium]|jgi:predicted Zn-dependent peptidase|nr:insulinase family protein [Bacteroidetes Order II. bacterium]MDG1754961.1 pitrilysin family protein [Rhodothermales bacterium]HAY36374.1 insulinase family protein [Bacteroidota bacterium]MBT5250947.1 insulinase family protein [Bacteroidetes Order II. bacterium]MBT6201310.1 insulinase family protein [Bacteroidetes Order II. bacterium]